MIELPSRFSCRDLDLVIANFENQIKAAKHEFLFQRGWSLKAIDPHNSMWTRKIGETRYLLETNAAIALERKLEKVDR